MKRKLIPRFFLVYLFLIGISILLVSTFSNQYLQSIFIKEKQNVLQEEANFLIKQYIKQTDSNHLITPSLQSAIHEKYQLSHIQLWICKKDGTLLYTYPKLTKNILNSNVKKLLHLSSSQLQNPIQKVENSSIFSSEMLTVGEPIFLNKEQVGFLFLHAPTSDLSSTLSQIKVIVYAGFLLLLFLIFLLLLNFSRRILFPLGEINHAAREYAKGNFETTIPVERHDEIGELVDSLHFMASELSKSEQYRKEFISNISHDFRSPLTSIKGYLEAMLDGTIPKELYERYLSVLLDETTRLTKLTEGLVALKTFNGNAPILHITSFDIIKAIKRTRNTLEGQCEKKNISIQISSPITYCMVDADKTKIQQVLYNLIDNAIKFSNSNGEITITLKELGQHRISISVKDNGIGIPRSEQTRIWERFYKVDNSRGKDKKSHGIGLAITKEIIHAHNEQINLISTENVGSEFVFTLPKTKS